jgi:hypothetical protein
MEYPWLFIFKADVDTSKLLDIILYRLQNSNKPVKMILINTHEYTISLTDFLLEKYAGKFSNIELYATDGFDIGSRYHSEYNIVYWNCTDTTVYTSDNLDGPGCYHICSGKSLASIEVTLGIRDYNGFFRGIDFESFVVSNDDMEYTLVAYVINQLISNNVLDFERITWSEDLCKTIKTPLSLMKKTLIRRMNMHMGNESELTLALQKTPILALNSFTDKQLTKRWVELLKFYNKHPMKLFKPSEATIKAFTELNHEEKVLIYSFIAYDLYAGFGRE